MRKLTYTVTTDKGSVHAGITSFDEARNLISRDGGHMVAVMKEITSSYTPFSKKRVRPKAVAPVEE